MQYAEIVADMSKEIRIFFKTLSDCHICYQNRSR